MEAAIRFSRNSAPGSDQNFLHVDVTGKVFRLCRLQHTKRGIAKYDIVHSSTKAPAFRAFDWHPINETLVVVGQGSGEATLLNIAEGQQDSVSFQVRNQRLCYGVALNSQNLLASGLDRVRTDFCLNIWDFNQRLPVQGAKGFSKVYADPVHKLAAGEPITSLKFFHQDPQLLIAGVKGQFVRLYDLREPANNNGFQFPTRCVNNLAIDWLDENYFASCFPTNDPSICLWDRRMVSRSNSVSQISFASSPHAEHHPSDGSLEIRNAVDNPGSIWSLRFSKSRSGCLGVLSSTGHLKVYDFSKEYVSQQPGLSNGHNHDLEPPTESSSWEDAQPQEVYLESAQDVERSFTHPSSVNSGDEKLRTVSFDFLTSQTRSGQAKMITLSGYNAVKIISTRSRPQPAMFSATGYVCRGTSLVSQKGVPTSGKNVGDQINHIRRKAELHNPLKRSFRQQSKHKTNVQVIRRMSSLDNQAWNSDLGFFEKSSTLKTFLTLNSISQFRCEAGYLLDSRKNQTVTGDSHWLQSFWNWVERATRLSQAGNMTQENLDLSYIGVYGFWMEDLPNKKNRLIGSSSLPLTKIIQNLVKRLSIPKGHICNTEYLANRQICLHVAGLAWSEEELDTRVTKLSANGHYTKAAALALFAGERNTAYKALRSKKTNQSHKMLAMAIAGAARHQKAVGQVTPTASAAEESENDETSHDDWSETIAALVEELTDPYARAILAYVKSGDWSQVVLEESLPLKYRVGIALRHFDDSALTRYISLATKNAITSGDIEGVIMSGLGTKEALDLMSSYVARFGDLQTAVLALCFCIPRYLNDPKTVRKFSGWKETYRHQMNSWGLKFDRVRFDIASQKLAVDATGRNLIQPPRPQIRLVCGFCTQPLAQNDRATSNNPSGSLDSGLGRPSLGSTVSMSSSIATTIPLSATNTLSTSLSTPTAPTTGNVDTARHPLTSEKAAAIGVVCPKCGRHLPRCGVCDKWLGTPDESFLKWYNHAEKSEETGKSVGENTRLNKTTREDLNGNTKRSSDLSNSGLLPENSRPSGGLKRTDSNDKDNSSDPSHRTTPKPDPSGRSFSPLHKSKLGTSMMSKTTHSEGKPKYLSTSTATLRPPTTKSTPDHSGSERPRPNSRSRSTSADVKSSNKKQNRPSTTRGKSDTTKATTSDNERRNERVTSNEDEDVEDEDKDEDEGEGPTVVFSPREIRDDIAREQEWDRLMARFTVFCVKCHHGFHAGHARMWFGGKTEGKNEPGRRQGHKVCPVASCKCLCNE